MDRAVDDEPRRVDGPLGAADHVPLGVDLDEVRRGHLVVSEAIGVGQEVVPGARHADGDVVHDHLAPAEMIEDPVAAGELHAEPRSSAEAEVSADEGQWAMLISGRSPPRRPGLRTIRPDRDTRVLGE